MITEDYCSYEVAKLLKEKGFNEKTFTYFENGLLCHGEWFEWNNSPMNHTSAPTLQMAMKWLREVHNIHVVPKFDFYAGDYTGRIYDGRRESAAEKDDYIAIVGNNTYEQACDGAIKYCLENLI